MAELTNIMAAATPTTPPRAEPGPSGRQAHPEYPLGLVEVHRPSGPPLATVVCVHGFVGGSTLGGSTRSWTNFDVKPPFFWLRDGLARDFPRLCILSFGHSKPILGSSVISMSITDQARNLHNLLELDIRTSESPSPIIFVAHSFGGSIVKNVLAHSALSPTQAVHQNTIAVLFFGTPHRVSPAIGTVERLVVTGGQSSGPHFEASRELQVTNESWRHILDKYTVVNFYETIPSRIGPGKSSRIIVAKEEATLNTPNELVFALAANHLDLIRYMDRDDASYRTVCSVLTGILRRGARDNRMVRLPPAPPTRPREAPAKEPQRIDFEGFVHGFHQNGLGRETSHSVSDLQEKSPVELLSAAALGEDTEEEGLFRLVWVHIPLTNTAWVNPCLQSIAKSHETDLFITDDKYWLSRARKSRANVPHSRHFEPSSFIQCRNRSRQFVIYLPYIHWDTFECFSRWSKYLNSADRGEPVDMPPNLPFESSAVYTAMRDDCRKTSSLHPRRTLDQFFYSTLPETSTRDCDQVVSKNTATSRGGKKMVMVDQMWLWVVESAGHETAVMTCFPQKNEEGGDAEECFHGIADLRQAVLDGANGREEGAGAPEWNELVGLLLDQAVNGMLSVRNEQSLDFLSVFRMAIGKATEEQSDYFRQFQEKLAPNDVRDRGTKREEVKLALEIADILDELNSIDRLFETQVDALVALEDNLRAYLVDIGYAKLSKEYGTAGQSRKDKNLYMDAKLYEKLAGKVRGLVESDIAGYRKQIGRMMEDAKRTKANLLELLDLQQKEQTLREAQYSNQLATAAREQADETAGQAQLLFLSGGVTTVFLPLSFFTSYFGMNVTEITGEEGNTSHGAVWMIMGPISGTIIVGLLGAAFYINRRIRQRQRERKNLV